MIRNDVRNIVLDFASASISDKTVNIPDSIDWQAVFDEVKKHNIVSLVYPIVEKTNIPDDILTNWKKERDRYLLNNARNIGYHISIHQLMDKANIPYVILKGVASGSYYPNYLLRAYGDVDFLVADNDFQKTANLLISDDYFYVETTKKHMVFQKNNVIYELHNHIFRTADTQLNLSLDKFFSDIFESAVVFRHNDSECLIPSDKHNAVILLLHIAEHIAETGIGLRHLLDWAAFANKMDDAFFSQEMKPFLKKIGLWHFCCILTALCTKYLGLSDFSWASNINSEYLKELMEDIFKNGEFGNIYKNDLENNLKIESINNYRHDDLIKSFITIINRKSKKLSLIKRVPILLPFGWIYVLCKYSFRTLLGKRTIRGAKNIIIKSAEKKQIIQEWHLFEKEE